MDLAAVGKRQRRLVDIGLAAHIIEHHYKLNTGDIVIGTEGSVGIAVYNAFKIASQYAVMEPALYIGERIRGVGEVDDHTYKAVV